MSEQMDLRPWQETVLIAACERREMWRGNYFQREEDTFSTDGHRLMIVSGSWLSDCPTNRQPPPFEWRAFWNHPIRNGEHEKPARVGFGGRGMNAKPPTTITVPANLEDRWDRVVERVAKKMGYSIEEARDVVARNVVSRGIEHLERLG